jgi:hypothetical protein
MIASHNARNKLLSRAILSDSVSLVCVAAVDAVVVAAVVELVDGFASSGELTSMHRKPQKIHNNNNNNAYSTIASFNAQRGINCAIADDDDDDGDDDEEKQEETAEAARVATTSTSRA